MTESPARNSAKSSVDLTEAPIRVLSVDDEAGFLKITKQILEVHDAFQVDTASSVDEAMDKMKKTTYDVIVSDYQMPGKDGLQFLKELRDGENDVPFILFTGKGREEIAIESLNLGADGYFNKMGDSETVYGELVHGIRQAVEKKKAEQEVAKTRDEYLSITNLTGDIIVNIDREGRWAFLNDGACMFWGKPREELLGKTFRDYLHPEDYEKTAASAIQENIETRQIVRGVINRQKTPKGWRTVEWNAAPLFDKSGEYVGMQATGRDITERKRAEEAIEHLARFPSENPNPVIRIAKDGVIIYANTAAKSLLSEWKREVGQSVPDFWRQKVATSFASGSSMRFEIERLDRVVSFEVSPVTDAGYVNAYGRDITERKKAEDLLQRSERRWIDSFNSLEDVMLIINTDYIIEKINDIGLKLFGKTREEVIGKKCFQILHNLDSSIEQCPFKRTLKTGKAESVDLYDKTFDKYFNVSCSPIFNERDEIVRHVDLIKDITESKKSEKALEESEERYRSLFESAREGITITDSEGKIVRMNDAFATMLGYDSAEELVGFSAVELYHDREARRILFEEIGERGYVEGYELTLKKRDGSPISVLGSSLTRKDEEGNILQTEGFFMDITERKKVENALEESEERYRRLFESIREGMIITGPEGKLLRVNRAAATMLGYDSPEELVGILAVELYLDPKDREAMFKETMRRGYVDHYEVTFKKRDGSPIYILGSNVTRKDEEGKIVQIEAFFMDITERKTREEEMKRRLMRFRLDDGNLYLVKESFSSLSLEAFKDLLNVGYRGLVFSRTPEEEFKKNVDGSFEFRWLAERGGEKSLSKFEKIENNLEKSLKKSVILLDGLDYLILKNGFKEALFFVQYLREFTHLTDNVVVLSIDPSTLNAREIRLLEKEGREVEPQVFVRLPEDLMEILRFIYEHNALGAKPNYTDIRQELSISKPTVGKRIKSLINTGYVTENPRGRSKVLELTYKGMRLFLK